MLAIQPDIAKFCCLYIQGAEAFEISNFFNLAGVVRNEFSPLCMSHRTRTESIGPKLGYSRSDLADVVNSVCN